jgi:redox-sensitive bicupin YhaK (pirin superfamily)
VCQCSFIWRVGTKLLWRTATRIAWWRVSSVREISTVDVADRLDTTILYLYEGELTGLNEHDEKIPTGSVVLLDASVAENRGIQLTTGANPGKVVLMFAGKKVNEPDAWHGPIVTNTQEEVRATVT